MKWLKYLGIVEAIKTALTQDFIRFALRFIGIVLLPLLAITIFVNTAILIMSFVVWEFPVHEFYIPYLNGDGISPLFSRLFLLMGFILAIGDLIQEID